MSVSSFLSTVGKDLEKGFEKVMPFLAPAEVAVSTINPAMGAVFQTTVGTVVAIEQKFAAMNKQSGTGTQKLQEAAAILTPVLQGALGTKDTPTVNAYISAVVNFLNAIPAPTA